MAKKKKVTSDMNYAELADNTSKRDLNDMLGVGDNYPTVTKKPSYTGTLPSQQRTAQSQFQLFLNDFVFGTNFNNKMDQMYKEADRQYIQKQKEEKEKEQLKAIQEKQKKEEEARKQEFIKQTGIQAPTMNMQLPTKNLAETRTEQAKKTSNELKENIKNNAKVATGEEAEAIRQASKEEAGIKGYFKEPDALEDGYQFGDISNILFNTASDAFLNVTKGVGDIGQGISNWLGYTTADIAENWGNYEAARNIRRKVNNSKGFAEEGPIADLYKSANRNSVLGPKGQEVAHGIGNVAINSAVAMATGGLGTIGSTAATTATTFASSYGNNRKEAIAQGATDAEANTYGLISAAGEAGSELIFAGLGRGTNALGYGVGLTDLDDQLAKKIGSMFSSQLAKNLVGFTIKSGAEGLEEVISGLVDAIGRKASFEKDKDFGEILKDEKLLDQFIAGAVTSAFAQGSGLIQTTRAGQDFITNLNAQETKVYEDALSNQQLQLKKQNAIDEAYKEATKGKDLTDAEKAQVRKEVTEKVNNGEIELKKLTKEQVEQSEKYADAILNQYQTKQQYGDSDNDKVNVFRQDVKQYWDNSEKTNNFRQVVEKVIEDKNYNVRLDPNIKDENGNKVNGRITTLDNGEVEIRLNPYSDRAGEFLLTHEITHAIATDEMRNLVNDYMKKDTKFADAVKSLQETYNTADISDEVLADVSGQLFGNQEFINSLSMKNPNIFKRIYDKIIELANKITGNSNEALFIKNLKNKWGKAYRENYNNLESTKNSKVELSSITDSQGRPIDTNIHTYSTDAYSGQVNMVKEYQDQDGNSIAKIEYTYYDGKLYVNYIETDPNYRRQGLATRLIEDLQKEAKEEGVKIDYGYTTEDGTALLKNIENNDKNESKYSKIPPTQERTIQGLEDYDIEDLKEGFKGDIRNILEENGFDPDEINIVDMELHGSRLRGTARSDSDLDVVFQYEGDIREDDLFNILNDSDNQIDIEGIKVDFNPIQEDMQSYMKRSNEYDNEVKNRLQEETKLPTQEQEETKLPVKESEESDIDKKINNSMTMKDAKRMIELAFTANHIYDWYDGKYSNGDEWLKGEGAEEVALYAENTSLINEKFLHSLYEKDSDFGSLYFVEDIIDSYLNNSLEGTKTNKTVRLDTSKDTNYKDDKFYSPQEIKQGREVYDIASQRVTNANRQEVYKARADFVIDAHNPDFAESIGLTQQEVNKKVKSWANYPAKTMELSKQLNEGVARQNQWTGLENSSIVNTIAISNEELSKMVKDIQGQGSEWQRNYITSTMLALDTHIDYSNVTFKFGQGQELSKRHAVGEYQYDTDTILIGNGYQNTVAHEIGHYVDSRWARDLGVDSKFNHFLSDPDINTENLNEQQKQFVTNFQEFIKNISEDSYMGSKYVDSGRDSEYWQHNTEIFARFVAKFTEWTKNQATNNRYGYESEWYDDHFTTSQFKEFVKILQEKSMLDTTQTQNTDNEDIRYSKQNQDWKDYVENKFSNNDNVETTNNGKNLLAIHNLNAEQLQGILDLDGFPVPSIAITNPDIVDHSQFGDISVIFNKDTINPEYKANEVYDRDVWSPTFPQVDYELNEDAINKVAKELGIESWQLNDYAEEANNANYLAEKLLRGMVSEPIVDKYIKDNNLKYETVYKENRFKRSYNNTPEMKQFVNDNNITLEKLSTDENLMNEYLKLTEIDKDSELYKNLESSLYWYAKDHIKTNLLTQLENDIKVLNGEMKANPEIDEYKTNDNKMKVAKENGLENYLKEQVKSVYGDRGIYNGKEVVTENGRRSFWQLHDKYNLDNLVDAIVKQNTQSSQTSFMTSFGQINAGMAQRFNSIEDIRSSQNRIKADSDNNLIETYKDNIGNDISDLSDYYKHKGESYFGMQGFENSAQSLLDLGLSGEVTEENFRKILEENEINGNKVPAKLIKRTIEDLNNLKNLPTDYFEAKPQRAVGFDEVDAVIVPSDTDNKLKQQLEDKGIRVIEYDPDNDTARNDIMKALNEYKFSKNSTSFREYLENKFKSKGTTTILKDLVPVKEKKETKLPTKKTTKNVQTYQSQLDSELPNVTKDNSEHNRLVKRYIWGSKNDALRYNTDLVENALLSTKANRNGKLTVKQWLDVAKQIGINAADLKTNQIRDIAYGSWADLQPTKRITKYDRELHKTVPFNPLTADKWVNTIYNQVKDLKMQDFTQELKTQETKLPVKTQENLTNNQNQEQVQENLTEKNLVPEENRTLGEIVDWTTISKPEGNEKFRKHYQSIIQSNETTAQAKAIAKEVMGLDTYKPDSNVAQIKRADNIIEKFGADETLNGLRLKAIGEDTVKLTQLATEIATGERLIQYYSKIGDAQKLQEAIEITAMLGTPVGQATQAFAILSHQSPVGQVSWIQKSVDKANLELQQKYAKKNKQAPQFDFTSEMQQKILNSKGEDAMYEAIDEVYKELGQQVPKTHLEQLDEWRYFSMLANVKTHGRNMIGNLGMHGIQRIKDHIAGGIEDVVSIFNPDMERMHTLRKASKETKQFAKNDVENRQVLTQLGANEDKYNPQSRLQSARRTFKSDFLEKTLGRLFKLNTEALEIEDTFGLKSMYKKALAEYITANRIDVKNMTDEQLANARNYAVQAAKEATFHQASAVAAGLTELSRRSGYAKFALDALVPFKKTPINVAKTAAQYNPVGLVVNSIKDLKAVRNGDMTTAQYIDRVSRGLTGSGLAFVGYMLAEAGFIKAEGPEDDKKEQFDEEQGKQSYSLIIGGKSYSLDWAAPSAIPMFIGARFNEIVHNAQDKKGTTLNENDFDKLVHRIGNLSNSAINALNPMSEMSMIQGLTSTLASYNKQTAVGDLLVNTVKTYVNQYIPTTMSQIARTTDEYERSTKSTKTGTLEKAVDSTINQVKSKIPGLRQTLPVKTDIWGEPVKQSANLPLRAFNNFINPSIVKEITSDEPVNQELNTLYEQTGNKSVLPSSIDKKYTVDGQDYRMTDSEYAYYSKQYGQTAHKLISDLIDSPTYRKLTDEQKTKAISEIYEYAKEKNKIEYTDDNNISGVKPTTDYTALDELPDKSKSAYLSYKAQTSGMTKTKDKLQVLADSNYTDLQKRKVYEYSAEGKDDIIFQFSNEMNPDEYFEYKIADANGEFKTDKDSNGKTIKGRSAKEKKLNYINNNISGYYNRLMLMAVDYKLSRTEQRALAKYINEADEEEALEIFKKLSNNFKVDSDGKVYYK